MSRAALLPPDGGPTIDRPPPLTFDRRVLIVVNLAMLMISLPLSWTILDADASIESVQMFALAAALTSAVAGAAFGCWAFRQRRTIDALRSLSFRRPIWGGWWSVVWTITPAVALFAYATIEARTDSLIAPWSVFLALVAVRMMSFGALGTNTRRIVLDARRAVKAGALGVAFADFLLVVIVWSSLLAAEPDRDLLALPATILPLAVVLAAAFSLTYAKRVERWVLEWWDNRWGCTPQDVNALFDDDVARTAPPPEFAGRRLLPTAPLRLLVLASYVAFAATTAWSGWSIWSLRDELEDADGLSATVGRLDDVSLWFLGALLMMQASHAVWCVALAWNARRCTIGAPGVFVTALLFLLGPAIVAVGAVFVDDADVLALVVAIAVVVNLACWALSFSLLHRTLRALGRSTDHIASWSLFIAVHWVLLLAARSIVLVGDASIFAGLVLAMAIADAVFFLTAAKHARRAMRDVERATRDFDQVRRRRTTRQRRRDRAPGGVLVSASQAAPPSHR